MFSVKSGAFANICIVLSITGRQAPNIINIRVEELCSCIMLRGGTKSHRHALALELRASVCDNLVSHLHAVAGPTVETDYLGSRKRI
eukprot:8030393-Pyramimonas_sp.AAC.2